MFKFFKFNFKYLNFLIQSKSNKNRKISNFISIYYVSFFFLFNFKDFNFENRIRKRRSRTRSINSDGRSPAGSSASELSSASPPGNQHPSLFVCVCVCVTVDFHSLVGALFPLPRIILSMAEDGLLFKSFARINYKTQTPTAATILSGTLSGMHIDNRRN